MKHKCYVKMAFSTASSMDIHCQTLHGCQYNFLLVCFYWHRFKEQMFQFATGNQPCTDKDNPLKYIHMKVKRCICTGNATVSD
jgi:hypothetical protein